MQPSREAVAAAVVVGLLCIGMPVGSSGLDRDRAGDGASLEASREVARPIAHLRAAAGKDPQRGDGAEVDAEPAILSMSVVPEPGTALLLMMGLALLGACGSRARSS